MANIDLMVLAGDYVKTAVISEIKVKVGDTVKQGDVVLDVETNKLVQGIESPCDGVVEQILVAEGDDVEISKVVMVVGDGSGATAEAAPASDDAPAAAEAEAAPAADASAATGDRIFISPVAKKIAKEKGLDINAIAAAYPGKKIKKKDVLAFAGDPGAGTRAAAATAGAATAAAAGAAASAADTAVETPMKGLRKAVATSMRNSAYSKPHVTMTIDAEIDELLAFKDELKAKYPDRKITLTGMLALAVRSALREYPYMNGTATEDSITLNNAINLGIAVDVPDGLMVPVIKNSESMSGLDLFEAVNTVANGCREGTLGAGDYAGGTFTITNVGSAGIKYFTPIINAPEIAILGVGASRKELVLVDDMVEEHTVIGLSLSFDHAAVDGSPAGKFLQGLKDKIENPVMMSL